MSLSKKKPDEQGLFDIEQKSIEPMPMPKMTDWGAIGYTYRKITEALKIPRECLGCDTETDSEVCEDCGGTGKIKLLLTFSECDCQKTSKEKHTSHDDPPSEGAVSGIEGREKRQKTPQNHRDSSGSKRYKTKGSRRRKRARRND